MLDSIRTKSQSFMVKVIFGIIILVFVFWGISSGPGRSNSVATINGEPLTTQEYYQALQRAWPMQLQQTPELAANPDAFTAFKRRLADEMVLSRLMGQEAARLGVVITPSELFAVVSTYGVFQDENGKFDKVRYANFLEERKIPMSSFEEDLSSELLKAKMQRYIGMSTHVDAFEAKTLYSYSLEKRIAEYVLFESAKYKDQVTVSEEDIAAYYKEFQEDFRIPLRTSIEFIRLTPTTLASGYPLAAEDIQDYYDKNKEVFTEAASFLSRHIFIACPPDDTAEPGAAEKIAESQKRIEEVAAKLKQGEDFAALAQEYSEDRPSAEKGGLLDWMERGRSGAIEFDDAAFALKKSAVSAPVRTAFGFHIIKLEDKKEATAKPLASVKEEITATLGAQFVNADFPNVQKHAEDGLIAGTDFAAIAADFKTTVEKTGLVPLDEALAALAPNTETRKTLEDVVSRIATSASTGSATNGTVPATNGTAVSGAHSETIPVPLEITDGLALVRIVEASPSYIEPLAEVKEAITATIAGNKALVLAKKAATDALPDFKGTEIPEKWKGSVKTTNPIARAFPQVAPLGILPDLANAVFASPDTKWIDAVYETPHGAVIARTLTIAPVTDAEWDQYKGIFMAQLQQRKQQGAVEAYVKRLLEKGDVRVYVEALDQITLNVKNS